MIVNGKRLFRGITSVLCWIFVLFIVLTASECPGETTGGVGGGESTNPTLEVDITESYTEYDSTEYPWYFDNYGDNEEYIIVGADDAWDRGSYPINNLNFVSLLRFNQSQIEGKNVVGAALYLYNFDGTLDEVLQIDKIADPIWNNTYTLDDVLQTEFVEGGATVTVDPPVAPGTGYIIDVTSIVQDWATSGENYGLRLYSNQQPTGEERAQFRSMDFTSTEEEKPRLAIEYTE